MKRFLMLAFAAALSTSAVACSPAASPEGGASSSSAPVEAVSPAAQGETEAATSPSSDSGSSLFAAAEWPEGAASDVPVPSFSVSPSYVSDSDTFTHIDYENVYEGEVTTTHIDYENVPEGEVVAFVEQLKGAGFVHDISERKSTTSYHFSAENKEEFEDKTLISMTYSDDGSLSIMVSVWN